MNPAGHHAARHAAELSADTALDAAPPGRRLLAWAADFALTLALAVLLGVWAYHRVQSIVLDIPGVVADVGGIDVVLSGGDIDGVAADAGIALWRDAVFEVRTTFAALVLIVFVYHLVAVMWKGRTVGKTLLDLQVRPRGPAPDARVGWWRGARRAAATTVTDIGLFALACCLLLGGEVRLSVLLWVLAVVVFGTSALLVLGKDRRTGGDRLSDTVVVRTRLHQALAGTAVHGIREGSRIAAEGARAVAANERVQRALASQPAQQLQDTGRNAVQRARQLYRDQRQRDQTPAPYPYGRSPAFPRTAPPQQQPWPPQQHAWPAQQHPGPPPLSPLPPTSPQPRVQQPPSFPPPQPRAWPPPPAEQPPS